MRYYGTITRWNSKRGFGAATIEDTGQEIFLALAARRAHGAGLTIGLTVHLLLSLAQQGLVERNGNAWQRAVSSDPREAHAGVG